MSQRLLRRLCPDCKRPDEALDRPLFHRLGLTDQDIDAATFYTASHGACEACGGRGYKGRLAVVEVLPFSPEIRHHILAAGQEIDEDYLRRSAREAGYPSLGQAALRLALAGATSIEEARRVVFLQ
jgi:type II secretory ATPase GspE/PulE/Tfp pilus assembly ATPase PilB-like protein